MLAGVLITRGVLGIPVLAPKRPTTSGTRLPRCTRSWPWAPRSWPPALLHLLLLGTPRPFAFFASITALADVIAAAAPFTQPAPLASKVFTAIINIVVGVAVISLFLESGAAPPGPWDVPSPGGPMTTRRDASI